MNRRVGLSRVGLFRVGLCFAACVCLATPLLHAQDDIVDHEEQSTVRIFSKTASGIASGTGFIVGDGQYVVTNHHVVASHDSVQVLVVARGLKRTAVDLALDSPEKDLAVLRLNENTGRTPVTFGLRSGVKKQQSVIAAGFPGASDREGAVDQNLLEVKFTKGIISAYVQERTGEALYQISAPINPGNSGGPLFDECGRVIGVNYQKSLTNTIEMGSNGPTIERTPLGEGIAWSIQADEVVNLLRAANLPVKAESTGCVAGAVANTPAAASTAAPVKTDPAPAASNSYLLPLLIGVAVLLFVIGLVVVIVLVVRASNRRQRTVGPVAPTRVHAVPPQARAIRGLSGQMAGIVLPLSHGPLRFGREPGENNIVLQDARVSRRHCTVSLGPNANEVVITDCGSSHGTYLGHGERLASGASRSIYPSGQFYIVDRENLFEVA